MKVKSIVDVITNSSSEVFIAKTEDVKACFLELLGDDILPKNHYYSAETFEKILEDFNENYENRRWIEEFLSESGASNSHLLYKFKLSSDAIIALKYFGHTDEEIERIETGEDDTSISYDITMRWTDEDGNEIDVVRHPKQIVQIKLEKEVFKNDLIRRKIVWKFDKR